MPGRAGLRAHHPRHHVVNFAQGDFAMLGAYMMVACLVGAGLPYWLSFVLALIGMGCSASSSTYGVYYPLRHGDPAVIISTLGASIFCRTPCWRFRCAAEAARQRDQGGVQIGSVFLDSQYLVILAVTMVMVAFQYSSSSTRCGQEAAGTSQDKDMARLLGIPVALMIAITFITVRARWARRLL